MPIHIDIHGYSVEIFSFHTIVVGSGAAGLNAADSLYGYGQRNIAVVTEGLQMGVSRNAGSDKQTYYKLTLAGDSADSVADMAQTLFSGGCMHGDLALCEAALSVQAFYKLVGIGVPFPHNRYGEYVGYKTDHDPYRRATSAGPLTSRYMTEKLEAQVKTKGIRIFDGYKVIGIVTDNGECKGLIALNKRQLHPKDGMFVLFNCTNVVFAAGGPAGLYRCSVYPESQTGASGVAFEAGVRGCNLTEWQYGIASVRFRWNLSGSYQQVLPRYVSTDRNGNDACELSAAAFFHPSQMLNNIFLKGYQWPFDARKIENCGSSLIDWLVYREIRERGRRVFLDYTHNPSALQADFGNLGTEARAYLETSGALQATPFERLAHLNPSAIDLYRTHGIDLSAEMLEIAVCAQHNNGGLAVNCWWETNLKHFFAVGEAAGTHGVYRPGGSALNAGQVGGTRAAMYIAHNYTDDAPSADDFIRLAENMLTRKIQLAERMLNNHKGDNVRKIRSAIGDSMSKYAAHVRKTGDIRKVMEEAQSQLAGVAEQTTLAGAHELADAFENIDLITAQYVYTCAMCDYAANGGGSRGSYLVCADGDTDADLPAFVPCNEKLYGMIQEIIYRQGICHTAWTNVRPIPRSDDWFENVWKDYLSNNQY
ncbi:MAG: FAD-binding protein [Bacteroidales bacterium]|jgi:succinate dehydrogenase/fumarate reductase flavoprotein subunit|nr:FAD-binding protein [Bacteroidales bacterium]